MNNQEKTIFNCQTCKAPIKLSPPDQKGRQVLEFYENKYLNTKCDWCRKESKNCGFHQKYNYKRCLKELAQEKRARIK
ncbi:1398_t:CDS:2 [Funneliformis geosporum]|uniref:1398_t:CDS:1 n=1 Tax=Funneliformis geosporum TaxID=1117311 RepID=A0A9W4WYT6_9GLOM|nr:1398_t:CDS:2 [Funneliformis geosporum]